jgi:DNA-binding response OmpR family regulator
MSGGGERGIILVAEDDAMVRNLVRLLLGRAGFRVLAAADGPEALEISRNFGGRIDLLLADVNMPGMKGTMLAQQVKRERPEIAILIMSGGDNEWVKDCGTSYLGKPFSPEVLVRTVSNLIRSEAEAACGSCEG